MSTTVLDRLHQALSDKFEGEVTYASSIPTTFTAPSVVVAPGDPFLEPHSFGAVRERWDILVVVNFSDKKAALTQMRDISLRVREAVSVVGATWVSASGPRTRDGEQNRNLVLSVNQIHFVHQQEGMNPETGQSSS